LRTSLRQRPPLLPLLALLPALLLAPQPLRAQPAEQRAASGGAVGELDGRPLLELASFPRSSVRISRPDGSAAHEFRVWIADTPERQTQGLMFVRDLPASEGMLFINERPRLSGFWMRNTYIPLDMLFIDARGRIVTIHANTTPLSLQTLGSSKPVLAMLELRGGETARRGIRVGDRVAHAAFAAPRDRGIRATTD
jgi:uncharacterized membrane protein (UPF0127 family)